jgi:alpha-tubulin suppressor-like RCC1 family protein
LTVGARGAKLFQPGRASLALSSTVLWGSLMKNTFRFPITTLTLALGVVGGGVFACAPSDRTFETDPGTGGAGGAGQGGGAAGTGGSGGSALQCMSPAECPGGVNASAVCKEGKCGVICNQGFVDCDAVEPGCETLSTTSANCGACGNACATSCFANDTETFCNDPIDISAGYQQTCVIRKDGSLWCWGNNQYGEIGVKGSPFYPVPIAVPLPGKVKKVSAGGGYSPIAAHTCVLLEDTTVMCWGEGKSGQLGTGSFGSSAAPQPVVSLVNIIDIAAGGHHTCAIHLNEELYCWGSDASGQLGNGPQQLEMATPILTMSGANRVGAGQDHTCAVVKGGGLNCWGENGDGQLGINTMTNQLAPTKVLSPLDTGVEEIALGDRHTCARKGIEVYCFGNDYNGAVGVNAFGPVLVPTLVSVPAAKHIDIGRERSGAISGDMGSVRMWGIQALGDGSMGLSGVPIDIKLDNVARLAVGYDHTCALKTTGEVLCWGENAQGQLGINMDTGPQYLPVTVAFPKN